MKTPTTPPACGEGDELEAARSLLAVYEGLASLPLERCPPGDIQSILRAIEDNRLSDAVDLIDVSRELDAIDFAVEGDADCPVPNAAVTWRYDCVPGSPTGVRLHSVDDMHSVPLKPVRAIAIEGGRRWIGEVGDLPAFGHATLEAGLKGELVIMLFAGALTIANEDGRVIGELSASKDGYATQHFVFCREQNNSRFLEFQLIAHGPEPVRGVWSLSTSRALSDDDRSNDPHNTDVFIARDLLPFGDAVADDGVFCSGAKPCSSKGYPHKDIVAMGGLDRASLEKDDFVPYEKWTIDQPKKCAALITGVQAGKALEATALGGRRQLVAHGDGMELIVALRGITWVAVTGEKEGHESESRYELSHDIEDDSWLPAYVTGLVAPGGTGHDIMLLNPSYYHTAWTQPDSDARFLHVFFADPREIALKHEGGSRKEPERPVVKIYGTGSGGRSGGVTSLADGDSGTDRWVRASACEAHRGEAAVVVGPWAMSATARGGGGRAAKPGRWTRTS